MKKAFIFPGQGAQYVGMGKDFYDAFSVAKETFQEADDLLGLNLSKIIFDGPEERLTETSHAQLAIYVTSMAILRIVESQIPALKPDVCSGLSLGEYTALTASGRLKFSDTLLLVKERARLMNEACEQFPGTMAAVLGLDALGIQAAVKDLDEVWVANYNAPGQTVISGTHKGVEHASVILKECGAKRVIPLTVHGAFHSGLMQSAQDGLAPYIEQIQLLPSSVAFVMNVPGNFVQDTAEIKKNMITQVTQSVSWEQGVCAMKQNGVELFIEIGCGKTLTGLNRKMSVAKSAAVEKVSDLESIYAIT